MLAISLHTVTIGNLSFPQPHFNKTCGTCWIFCHRHSYFADACGSTCQAQLKHQIMPENILITTENRVQTITINRPKQLNALNKATIAELGDAFDAADANPEVRVIIVTGLSLIHI